MAEPVVKKKIPGFVFTALQAVILLWLGQCLAGTLFPMQELVREDNLRLASVMADIGYKNKPMKVGDEKITPLAYALRLGKKDIADMLVDKGATADAGLLAASLDSPAMLTHLVRDKKVPVNTQDSGGDRPIIFRTLDCSTPSLKALYALLKNGASPDYAWQTTIAGKPVSMTPLYAMALGNCLKGAKILLKFGANTELPTGPKNQRVFAYYDGRDNWPYALLEKSDPDFWKGKVVRDYLMEVDQLRQLLQKTARKAPKNPAP